jgi:hypothetical protein
VARADAALGRLQAGQGKGQEGSNRDSAKMRLQLQLDAADYAKRLAGLGVEAGPCLAELLALTQPSGALAL